MISNSCQRSVVSPFSLFAPVEFGPFVFARQDHFSALIGRSWLTAALEHRQNLPVDIASSVCQGRIMAFGVENQFSFTDQIKKRTAYEHRPCFRQRTRGPNTPGPASPGSTSPGSIIPGSANRGPATASSITSANRGSPDRRFYGRSLRDRTDAS